MHIKSIKHKCLGSNQHILLTDLRRWMHLLKF